MLLFLALPLAAREVDSNKLKFQALEDSVQSLNPELKKIEEHWSHIEKTAEDSRAYADKVIPIVLAIGGLIAGVFVVYGVINVIRVERDLKEVSELKKQAQADCEEIRKLKKEVAADRKRSEVIRKIVSYMNRGYNYLSQKKYAEALEAFEKAITEDPKNAEAWFEKGYCLSKLGKYEEAIEAYRKSIEFNYYNPSRVHYNIGVILGKKEKYDDAIKEYSEAIKIDRYNGKAHYNLACCYSRKKMFDESLESLRNWKLTGVKLTINPWEDEGLDNLKRERRKEFVEIFGPKPPEDLEKPKGKGGKKK